MNQPQKKKIHLFIIVLISMGIFANMSALSAPLKLPDEDVKLLERLMQEQFPLMPAQWKSGPFKIVEMDSFEDGNFFKKYKIFYVRAIGLEFGRPDLGIPNFMRTGLFAFDGKNLCSLNGSDALKNLGTVLKNENRPLEQIKPDVLLSLILDSIKQYDRWLKIVSSSSDLLQFEKNSTPAGHYKLNSQELKQIAECLKPVSFFGNTKIGWKLRFYALQGLENAGCIPQPPKPPEVCVYEFDISPKFDITMYKDVRTNKVFSWVVTGT